MRPSFWRQRPFSLRGLNRQRPAVGLLGRPSYRSHLRTFPLPVWYPYPMSSFSGQGLRALTVRSTHCSVWAVREVQRIAIVDAEILRPHKLLRSAWGIDQERDACPARVHCCRTTGVCALNPRPAYQRKKDRRCAYHCGGVTSLNRVYSCLPAPDNVSFFVLISSQKGKHCQLARQYSMLKRSVSGRSIRFQPEWLQVFHGKF
jgi:hypothetical protein